MKIVTWNVNSIRQRLPRLIAMLRRHEPDVVCLQETKIPDEGFPHDEVMAAGYAAVTYGQQAYNGVAILARAADPPADPGRGFPDDPAPDEARVLSARVGDLQVIDAYVVNGKAVSHPAYQVKLDWLDALGRWVGENCDPMRPMILAGDFNVAPSDLDVHDPDLWRGKNLASEPERDRVRRMLEWGLVDLGRAAAGDAQAGPFTWWDYRAGAFHRGWGLRIDLVLGTRPVADRLVSVEVDRQERKPTAGEGKPSDHAPVVVTLSD